MEPEFGGTGGEVELSCRPLTFNERGWAEPHLPLPSGSFLASFEAHTRAHSERQPTPRDEHRGAQCADINNGVYQHTLVRWPRGIGKSGMRAGRRKKSKKRRMEQALMGFRPSVRTEFDPLVYDPMGFCTPQHKR